MIISRLRPMASQAKRLYVQIMMEVVGRAMEAISEFDEQVQQEVSILPEGFLFEMKIMPSGPALVMRKEAGNSLTYVGSKGPTPPDLSVQFKHLTHAFMVLSFQPSGSLHPAQTSGRTGREEIPGITPSAP